MARQTRAYAHGTSVTQDYPWGLYVSARVLCSDGKVRATARIAQTADTFFSVPAAVKVKGKTVAGYMTVECLSGSSVVTSDDPAAVKFIAYQNGRNHHLLPGTAYRVGEE
jgi:hypothetical protein